jgi:hypothetical protein
MNEKKLIVEKRKWNGANTIKEHSLKCRRRGRRSRGQTKKISVFSAKEVKPLKNMFYY